MIIDSNLCLIFFVVDIKGHSQTFSSNVYSIGYILILKVKFIYSEKATKFCEKSTLLLSVLCMYCRQK